MLEKAGFTQIRITIQEGSKDYIRDWAPGINAAEYVVSGHIEAIKPAAK